MSAIDNQELTIPIKLLNGVTRLFMARMIIEADEPCVIQFQEVEGKWLAQCPGMLLKCYHPNPATARTMLRIAIEKRRRVLNKAQQHWQTCQGCGAYLTKEYNLPACLLCGHPVEKK